MRHRWRWSWRSVWLDPKILVFAIRNQEITSTCKSILQLQMSLSLFTITILYVIQSLLTEMIGFDLQINKVWVLK